MLRALSRKAIRPSAERARAEPARRLGAAEGVGDGRNGDLGRAAVEEPAALTSACRGVVHAASGASTGGVVWIAIIAALLAGVVAPNVAVLRLNMTLDELGRDRADLRAENAALAAQLSSAAASPRIQTVAARAARARAGELRADDLREASAVRTPVTRLVNRRIRLFLAVLTLAFGGLLMRATWLQGVRAESLSNARPDAAPRRRHDPGRSRHDLRPQGRRARDRRAGDDRLREPDAGHASRAQPRWL